LTKQEVQDYIGFELYIELPGHVRLPVTRLRGGRSGLGVHAVTHCSSGAADLWSGSPQRATAAQSCW
jgi:hypothetical protein